MRILQVGPVTPAWGGRETGGIATVLTGLAAHLAERGHDVAVLADSSAYTASAWPALHEGVAVYGVEGFSGVRRAAEWCRPALWRDAAAARAALDGLGSWRWTAGKVAAYRQVIRAFRPDIVHVHTLETRYAFAHVVIGGRAPLVSTVHSTHYVEFAPPERRVAYEALVRRGLAAAGDVLFVSRFLEDRYSKLFGPLPTTLRSRVIHNPIDVGPDAPPDRSGARTELGLDGFDHVLLFVGNLLPRKDPAAFIKAVARVADRLPGVVGVVVGEGPEMEAIRTLAIREGVADRIRYDGRKTLPELALHYAAADVLVFPSLMESFGLVALEAMLCGTPVVGTPEVLSEVLPEECGIRVEPGDPDALAAAIVTALERPWNHQAIRAYALGFSWEDRIGQFESVYEEILASR